MSLSVADFPVEVIEQILLFVPTPRAVLRVGTTNSHMSDLVSTNQRLWTEMYKRRWTVRDSSVVVYSLQHYRERHGQDEETLRQLEEVADTVRQKQDYGLGEEFRDPVWEEMTNNVESFDVLRAVARNDPVVRALYTNSNVTIVGRCLAMHLVDIVHFCRVFQRFYAFVLRFSGDDAGGVDELKEGTFLFAESILTRQELLEETPGDRMRAVRKTLDDISQQLQLSLEKDGGLSGVGPLVAIRKLAEILNVERRSEVEFDAKNCSISHVLKARKGHTLVLAIIYKLILHRAGFTLM